MTLHCTVRVPCSRVDASVCVCGATPLSAKARCSYHGVACFGKIL